jgi:toxin ParE1/3/4
MKSTRLLAPAEAELFAAAEYYERQRPSVGRRFLNAVEEAKVELEHFSAVGRVFATRFRSLRVQGFPYTIVYQERWEECLIVAVAHTSRRPGYWQERLK